MVAWETISCPLCECPRQRVVRRTRDFLYKMPGCFHLVRCLSCTHVYLNPRPTRETIMQFYPESYGPHCVVSGNAIDSAAASASREPWYLSPFARRLPGLRRLYYWLTETRSEPVPDIDAPSPQALELGCSTGRFLLELRNAGWKVCGVETSERAAVEARRQGLDVHLGPLESAQFADRSFDAVFAWMVLEHLHDPVTTLREIRRILKPNGWFLFSVPNAASWEAHLFGSYWYALQLPTHLHQFTQRSAEQLIRRSALSLVSVEHQCNVHNLIGSLGICLREVFPNWRLGDRLIRYTDQPTLWTQLALAPLAKCLAAIRQGGRLTVIARRLRSERDTGELP